ncbi:MAG: hypothetical protein LBJ74_06045 [Heliobacteriaceae bacterium]|jgi:hypothetical protein|nr:hypothetical protein [Heliobacteriaceae bacterium]
MASNKLSSDVGKKIVEALKKQSDVEIQHAVEHPAIQYQEIEFVDEPAEELTPAAYNPPPAIQPQIQPQIQPSIQPLPMPGIAHNTFDKDSLNDFEGFEIPTNVAVLRQLISQLPSGVTKQTGAQIIKQTMEALGISMKSVLQEAQQVQESLTNSSKECQSSIAEYKRQIIVLEQQSQKFQKQYSALNDIISLFVQTGNY